MSEMKKMMEELDKRLVKVEERRTVDLATVAEQLNKQHDEALQLLENKMKMDLQVNVARIETAFKAKLDTLMDIIHQKDTAINLLSKQIGELQKSTEMSDESIKKNGDKIDEVRQELGYVGNDVHYLVDKTSDLEDRGKRNNLIFNGFAETDKETAEDCEGKLRKFLLEKRLINNAVLKCDRVHRLGKK